MLASNGGILPPLPLILSCHCCEQRHGIGLASRTSNQAFDLSESLRRKLANRAPATIRKPNHLRSDNRGI